jgi:Ca2+-binding RTX toxin-like protein
VEAIEVAGTTMVLGRCGGVLAGVAAALALATVAVSAPVGAAGAAELAGGEIYMPTDCFGNALPQLAGSVPPGGAPFEGSPNDDVIIGTDGHDVILGNGGDDIICGGKGDDYILGDEGDDHIYCGYYGDDHDYAYGGLGNDTFDDCEIAIA